MSDIRTIAEIEQDNQRIIGIQSDVVKRSERYNNTVLDDEGWVLEDSVAKSILRTLAPEHATVECKRYYFINDKYSAAIVGVNEDNIGLFTVEIPPEVKDTVDDPWRLESTLQYFKEQSSNWKKVRVIGNLMMAGVVLLILFVTYVAFGYNSTTAVIMAVGLFGVILSLTVGLGG